MGLGPRNRSPDLFAVTPRDFSWFGAGLPACDAYRIGHLVFRCHLYLREKNAFFLQIQCPLIAGLCYCPDTFWQSESPLRLSNGSFPNQQFPGAPTRKGLNQLGRFTQYTSLMERQHLETDFFCIYVYMVRFLVTAFNIQDGSAT
jgi:hypothetical protein